MESKENNGEAFMAQMDTMKADFLDKGLPSRMWGGVDRYLTHGIPPGHFLTAILENDLKEACARADDENVLLLHNYVRFFYNCVPGGCWGSPEAVSKWTDGGGFSEHH